MTPQKGDSFISIPVTFDKQSKGRILTRSKFLWSALIFGCQLFIWVLILIAGTTVWKILFPFVGLTCWLLITRFLLLREKYFKAKRQELRDKNYVFDTSVFWNVNSIDESYPYFVRFGSGLLGLFVVFDKDVIVGRPGDDEYYHYEAIADAYQEMCKRNISCVHVDYMDVCGRDDRMQGLFHLAANAENSDLRTVLTRFYGNIEDMMNRAYASYDVYCFYSQQREELFWEDIQGVIGILNQANFVRSRILNSAECGKLVKTLFNLDDFSVAQACDVIYKDFATNFLKPIWTERDGKRTIINKTTEEMAEARRVLESEKQLRRTKQDKKPKLQKWETPEDDRISLWGDEVPELEKKEITDPKVLKQKEKYVKAIAKKQEKEAKRQAKLEQRTSTKKVKAKKGTETAIEDTETATKEVQSKVSEVAQDNVANKRVVEQEGNKVSWSAPNSNSVGGFKAPNSEGVIEPKKPVVKRRNQNIQVVDEETELNLFD